MSVMTNNNNNNNDDDDNNNNDNNNIARKLHTDMLGVHHKSDKLSISTWPQLFKRWIALCDDL